MDWPVLVIPGARRVGIVLVHDITGLDATNRSFAEALARHGYWVAAVDLFRGETAKDLQAGFALRERLRPGDVPSALRAAHDTLSRAMGPGAVVGSMGFCMGGGAALEGACHVPFAFCVDFYGRIPDADAVQALEGPLLLVLASEDDRINPWVYEELLPALDRHRKRVHVEIYPAVHHPFHRPDWPHVYDAQASADAWARVLAFVGAFG